MEPEPQDPRVMSETHYWIDCSVCGPAAEPPAPRFTSEAELWRQLLSPSEHGWVRRDDGRILCPAHRRVALCDEGDHEMTRWIEHPLDDELDWRFCRRCGAQFEQRIVRVVTPQCSDR